MTERSKKSVNESTKNGKRSKKHRTSTKNAKSPSKKHHTSSTMNDNHKGNLIFLKSYLTRFTEF